jgi:ribonuclease HI
MGRLSYYLSTLTNPFYALSKGRFIIPERVSHIQTDGSFGPQYKISRTACLMVDSKKDTRTLINTYLDHKNSYESEWSSVVDGIDFALKKKEYTLEIENDNLSVIQCLINNKRPKQKYVVDYFDYVMDISRKIDYLGIRWIPRELNKADDLFRF